MPIWLEILIAIIGLCGTILGILGITTYINERMKHKAEKQNKKEDELEVLKYNGYITELKSIINEAVEPIKEDLTAVKKGTQATCRNDLEEMYAVAEKQGYCSNEDKQKFEATYQAYHMLGKNGVMDSKREKILAMPETKPVKKCIRKNAKVSAKAEGE